MALKDWKKIINSPRFVLFKSKEGDKISIGLTDGIWHFRNEDIYYFKTKSQAISYAKSYMRSH